MSGERIFPFSVPWNMVESRMALVASLINSRAGPPSSIPLSPENRTLIPRFSSNEFRWNARVAPSNTLLRSTLIIFLRPSWLTCDVSISSTPWRLVGLKGKQRHTLYTNGKKKQCIAKILITQRIWNRWAWKFMNILFLIQTFNYQTWMRFHGVSCVISSFYEKVLFISSSAEKLNQQIHGCKTQVYAAYYKKTTLLLLIRWRYTFLKISFRGKMQVSNC